MKRVVALAMMLPLSTEVAGQDEAKRNRLIVHEWGTFTAVYGSDGTMLEWRPLETSDLPSFVYDRTRGSFRLYEGKIKSTARMETPVLYFYSDREMTVDVSVRFPKGLITEWYPRVREYAPPLSDGSRPLPIADGYLRWGRIRIIPQGELKPDLPREKGESHYYPARETDSAFVRVCPGGDDYEKSEHEKFLFYRGVGNFELPLGIQAQGNGKFVLTNPTAADLPHVFVISVKKDGKGKYAFLESVRSGQSREVALDLSENWLTRDQLIRRIGEELEGCLVAEGLFRKEAKAMIKTWTDSYFEQEGTRVLYVLPPAMTNDLLPLSVSPAPVELRRVLVGRVEILEPEHTERVRRHIRDLGSESLDVRNDAERKILGYGRFAEPTLQEVLRTSRDSELRARAEGLLLRMHVRK